MNQSGGKMIATGSKTCIFNPNIPCSKSKTQYKSKISKIYVSKKINLRDELKINKQNDSVFEELKSMGRIISQDTS